MHGTRLRIARQEKSDLVPNVWSAQTLTQDADGVDFSVELQRIIGLFRRQIRLIIAIALSITAVVGLVVLQLTPIYEASALMLVDPRQTNVLDPQSQVSLLPGDSGRVESEVGMIRSPSVLLAVIKQLGLTSDSEYAPEPGWRDWFLKVVRMSAAEPTAESRLNKTLTSLDSAVTVERRGLTYLIDIQARSNRPDRAADLANAVAAAHIQLQIAAKVAVASGILDALRQEARETGTSLSEAEVSLNAFYDRSIQSIEDPARRDQLVELRRQVEASEAERRSAESAVSSATVALRAADWQSLTAELESDALRRLNEDRNALVSKIRGSDATAAVDLRGELAKLEEQMTSEAQSAIEQAQARIVSAQGTGSEIENTLRQQLISELPPASVAELRQLQQEALASGAMYENLVAREKAVGAQQNLQLPDSRIVSNAIPPAFPTYPRKKLIIGLAGLGSLALALGLAYLRENYIGGFVDEDQAEAVLGIPVLSSVPQLADDSDEPTHAAEIVEHPLSGYSEAIRRARLSIEAEQKQKGSENSSDALQVILVASALPSEGKTQTAISLARSFALAGRRVLLIDADLRRPTIHRAFGITPTTGLSDALSRDSKFESIKDVAFSDPLTTALVIPGSPVRQVATAALLESGKIEDLLRSVAPDFDVVVIDSSPLLPVVDARLLIPFATAVVMVVRWAKTSQRDTRAALNDLFRHNRNGTLVGAILNRVESTSLGYGYGRYYAPYYLDQDT